MKLQLRLQYNSVQNDKKDSQSHKASHLHWMSHTISVFLFFSIMAIVILRHPLHAAHVSFHICGIRYVIYL